MQIYNSKQQNCEDCITVSIYLNTTVLIYPLE